LRMTLVDLELNGELCRRDGIQGPID
jgi:hypothetical protein